MSTPPEEPTPETTDPTPGTETDTDTGTGTGPGIASPTGNGATRK
jgi:hypothetical protein